MLRAARFIAVALVLPVTPALAAETPKTPPPAVVRTLLDCRAITDAGQRLACLDAGVAALASAVESRDVVVSDREQVTKARRGLFGIAPPGFRLFGGGAEESSKADDAEDRVPDAIEAVISAASPGRDGNWRFTLDDGSRWIQTEARTMRRDPAPGMKVRIRAAAMGSYLANVDEQTAIRVKRVDR
ncbi:MAG: hypothetical protein MUE77_02075 [Sandarakinorhabdus sp.]|jgi:hypothetical protein|nr:hypothetical protein [Sandarakinorhabdus sp.]